ncbi:PAS domain-containing sensor histidine kinase [Beijerinckia mobilis]|uniref:PAS domain-containing sensor histidine kinase n=1 Tax=Beijerinckia mobilis TaxID=231434 RepID=UPI0012EBC4E6|nr:PAS domain-containing sensor histidine kinase [Beijerinckia mobilis]
MRFLGGFLSPWLVCRERSFMLRQGLQCLAVIGATPFVLPSHAVFDWAEALVLAALLLPLSALVFVALTEVLIGAQTIVTLGLCLTSIALALAGAGIGPVGAALFIAAIEAFLTLNPIVIGICGLSLFSVLTAMVLVPLPVYARVSGIGDADILWLGGSLLYASILMLHGALLRKRDERRHLCRATPNMAEILDNLVDLAVVHDRMGCARALNRIGERLLGIDATQLQGRGFFDHVHVLDRPLFLQALANVDESAEPCRAMVRLRGVGETPPVQEPFFRWFDVSMSQMPPSAFDAESRMSGATSILAIYHDITELKQQEERLVRESAEALAAHQAKDRFLANMSHELRTPLNAIIGFAEMLSHPNLCPSDPLKQREYATIIHESGEHLLHVVNSILDMSKIHSGTFILEPQPLLIAPLIEACCDMLRPSAEAKQIHFEQILDDTQTEILADRQACKQILLNLLSNAVKFTPPSGSVSVAMMVDEQFLWINVRDTGIGIEASDISRLGEPFFQAGDNPRRQAEGTGLGLSIVQGLVDLHGGKLVIESELAKGTSMNVYLPREGCPDDAIITAIEDTDGRAGRKDQCLDTSGRRHAAAEISMLKDAKVRKIA